MARDPFSELRSLLSDLAKSEGAESVRAAVSEALADSPGPKEDRLSPGRKDARDAASKRDLEKKSELAGKDVEGVGSYKDIKPVSKPHKDMPSEHNGDREERVERHSEHDAQKAHAKGRGKPANFSEARDMARDLLSRTSE